MEPFDPAELLGEFREEAAAQLDQLEDALLSLEREGALDASAGEALQRALHTLKGNAGMLNLGPVRDLVHRLESVFREAPQQWAQQHLDRLFDAARQLRAAVAAAGGPGQAEVFERLRAVDVSRRDEDSARPPRIQAAPEGASDEAAGSDSAALQPNLESRGAPAPDRIRVPFRRLDDLLNQAGELGALNLAFGAFLRQARPVLRGAGLWEELTQHGERLGRLSRELRDGVMELRLVPIAAAFARFPRVARDLAHEQGKRVEVVVRGESTELDKSTVDSLAEPLLHLVRNAIDHGLETPDERKQAGKPPQGLLMLSAHQDGSRVRVVVEDDGRGLDRERILARAQERGLVERGAPVDAAELILRQGFTTRDDESMVSGRGVGLDVVRRQVQELRGEVHVGDRQGGGTRFVLELPLTVAILSAVLFESAGEVLALPALSVEETIRTSAAQPLGRAETVRYRGQAVPLTRPGRVFGWSADDSNGAAAFALVVRRGDRRTAVFADRLLDQRDLMVKRLPPFLGRPAGVTGVTVTPGGQPVLLLDPETLLDLGVRAQRQRG